MNFRNVIGALAIGLAVSLPAAAAPTLQINGSGLLTGALNVDVGGTLYDVQFLEGTCFSLFNSCGVSDFDFHNALDATKASQALLDQVFLDSGSGLFDTNPHLTFGCDVPGLPYQYCDVFTPFGPTIAGYIGISFAENIIIESFDSSGVGGYSTSGDTTGVDLVWARWSPSDAVSVSEPSTFALLGAGLFLGMLRYRVAKQDVTFYPV